MTANEEHAREKAKENARAKAAAKRSALASVEIQEARSHTMKRPASALATRGPSHTMKRPKCPSIGDPRTSWNGGTIYISTRTNTFRVTPTQGHFGGEKTVDWRADVPTDFAWQKALSHIEDARSAEVRNCKKG